MTTESLRATSPSGTLGRYLLIGVCLLATANTALLLAWKPYRRPPIVQLALLLSIGLVLGSGALARRLLQRHTCQAVGGPCDGRRWIERGTPARLIELTGPGGPSAYEKVPGPGGGKATWYRPVGPS